ncbi:MAG: rhomboid family intramembrane serine protease [Paracoccaceae bacterium]|nr:rhomboid family intramembrane serine protease [Paracoccaceae bacterium]MDE3122647.1 rhomboid family intramembrane serine protease [Paracoccaceae bacterium]MDE3238671.1 rhomboid family intramembrane serine protease [Paracoccaceae bacterium]
MIDPDTLPPQPRIPMTARLARWFRDEPVTAVLFTLCIGIEAILQGADYRLWGGPHWRDVAYTYGGFWGGLLHGWQPAYAGQGVAMFLSYSFLHGGILHVGMNMMALISLGRPVSQRLGQGRYLALYLLSAIGGGLGFALITYTTELMVGASGALFGLAGAILAWAWADRRRFGQSRVEVARVLARPLAYLVGINVVMFWALSGGLAWGCHLGGFVTGWALGLLLDRRYRRFA